MHWVLFISLWSLVTIAASFNPGINPVTFSSTILNLTENALKYREMQAHLDTLQYTDQGLNGTELLEAISNSFARKFNERNAIVRRLRDAVVTSYSGVTSSNNQCCNIIGYTLELDQLFKQEVHSGHVCERISSGASTNPTKLQSSFKDACIRNYQSTPSLKWQYFGSEQGVTTLFPSSRAADCTSYDNRFRPWYVQANVPKPKQVVVVIDKSGSMGVTNMNLAKEAAKSVINTLNPRDRFAFIAFSSSTSTYTSSLAGDSCFANKFADASPQNKKKVSTFIDQIFSGGGTYYSTALTKAFAFFQSEPGDQDSSKLDRVILFMSDGAPSDSASVIMSTQIRGNEGLNNSVIIMTYGLGSADFTVLMHMAQNNGAAYGITKTLGVPDARNGLFTRISVASRLRSQMSSYYNFFGVNSQGLNEPIWTTPYLDGWGLGILITASLPVYVSNTLVGVTAVDITIEELLAESSFFKPNELSYSFVINSEGLAMNHPLFSYLSNIEPLLVPVTAYERNSEFLSVFESMKRGESGKKTFMATRILPQGDSSKYGIREVRISSTYFWKQIPGTKFSLCVVLAVGDTQAVLQSQRLPSPNQRFLYHRLDLVPPTTSCKHLNSLGAKSETSVMLAPRAYLYPSNYMSTIETTAGVTALKNYMLGTGSNSANVKNGIRDVVFATSKVQEYWTATTAMNQELQREILWRYIGTKGGVFRMYPGSELPKNFDPVVRPWYEHATANPDKFVITPPYKDAPTGNSIITLSKAIFEGRTNGIHNTRTDEIVAVMGVDFVLSHFQTLFHQDYPECGPSKSLKCHVIDLAGYVIISDDATQSSVIGRHVTEVDAGVSKVLIKNGIMAQKQCSNIELGVIQRTYKIDAEQPAYTGLTSGSPCYNFKLIPISGTNAFIIAKQSATCLSFIRPSCTCSNVILHCSTTWNGNNCECPCNQPNPFFRPCTNDYKFTDNEAPPCTPENHELSAVTSAKSDVSNLPVCYTVSFTVNNITSQTPKGSSLSTGAIVGIAVGGAFVIIVVAIIYRKRSRPVKQPRRASHPSAPPFNPHYSKEQSLPTIDTGVGADNKGYHGSPAVHSGEGLNHGYSGGDFGGGGYSNSNPVGGYPGGNHGVGGYPGGGHGYSQGGGF